ncbi:MAG: DUF2007 domain-containing protein [Chloroflexi bacterium]|nr:DUF2007 domain-containing protein [Chloroflexota bacterium]
MTESQSEHLVVVFTSQGPLAAEVAKSKLEVNGIPAILSYQSVARAIAVTIDGLGLVKVLVNQADQARALQILEPVEDSGEEH